MIDLKSPETFRVALYFIVPGLIAVFFRAQFLTGRIQKHTDAILTYFSVSIVYWSAMAFVHISPSVVASHAWMYFVFTLVLPAVLGCVLGLNARLDVLRNILRKVHLNPVHPTATAWDWKLSRTGACYVLVTMTEGEIVAGSYDRSSFSSSDPAERDIFLEKVFEVSDDGPWKEVPGKEILIRASEIRYIEFFPMNNEEASG